MSHIPRWMVSVLSCRILFNLPYIQTRSFPKNKEMLLKAACRLEQKMALN